jgi:diguanylate cyclase (GGDEF)-like protein
LLRVTAKPKRGRAANQRLIAQDKAGDVINMFVLALWESTSLLPASVALAAVATLAYLFGRRAGKSFRSGAGGEAELQHAQQVASELEQITEMVRQHLAAHQASIVEFKQRVAGMSLEQNEASWQQVCKEAEGMMRPTLKLATQLASAYDEIRQQTGYLMSFTDMRTDPLTGVSNRRALEEQLASHLAVLHRHKTPFSIVIFDIDHFKRINAEQGLSCGDALLAAVAKGLADSVRDTDVVTRYGGEEFVIIMPQTMLDGACVFANRLRERTEASLPLTVSGGVAAATDGDTAETLLARADAALYGAKAAGRNRVFFHNGIRIQAYPPFCPSSATKESWPDVADAQKSQQLIGQSA